jgi:putative FmdB family regulatory protein
MPLYDFNCGKCGTVREVLCDSEVETLNCDCGGTAYKAMGAPSFRMKGGFTADNGYSSAKPSLVDKAPR